MILSLLLASAVAAAPAPSKPVKKAAPSAEAAAEARRRMIRGAAGVKAAAGPADLKDAAAEFEAAAAAVPGMADAWYNAGMTYAKAGEHAAAIRDLKRYIELSPKAPDLQAAKDKVTEEEFLLEKSAKAGAEAAREDAEKAKSRIVPGVGVGPVRVGVSVDEALASMPGGKRSDYDNNNGYRGVSVTWGAYPETIYTDFYKYAPSKFVTVSMKGYATADGLAPGSSVNAAMEKLGAPARRTKYRQMTEACWSNGLGFGWNDGSDAVDHIFVFPPSTIVDRCPDL